MIGDCQLVQKGGDREDQPACIRFNQETQQSGHAKAESPSNKTPLAVIHDPAVEYKGQGVDLRMGTFSGVGWTPNSQFIGKEGKPIERPVGAPDDVREIEAGLERRVNWFLGS